MRGIAIALMVLAATAVTALAEEPGVRQAKAYYIEGMKQYNLGHYRAALDAFEAGYLARPDAAFLFNLGQCHRMLGEAAEAVRAYRAYLRERPGAGNRREVEQLVEQEEKRVERKAAERPPTGTMAPAPAAAQARPTSAQAPAASTPAVSAALSAAAGVTPIAPVRRSKRWAWILGGGVAAAVVGVSIGLGVGLGMGEGAPGSTLGNLGSLP